MALFRRDNSIRLNPVKPEEFQERRASIPDNLFERCPSCGRIIVQKDLGEEHTCPKCGHHFQFPALERLEWLLDAGSFQEWQSQLTSQDPLDFPGYQQKLEQAQDLTQMEEAVIIGQGQLDGIDLAIGVMDSRFIMASMGTVVGEKLTSLFEMATDKRLPVIIYVASGGARMQEGILSLMQMAKVTQAVSRHSQAGLFYVAVLTHPTTGGVTASFAMQGDVTLAEPKATVGFAGKRVIQQTITSDLPADFQEAETVMRQGFIDQIVPRNKQHQVLSLLLRVHQDQGR